MNIPSILGVATLIIGIPLNAYVTWKLWRLHQLSPGLRVLRERVIVAAAILLLVLAFGLIFINNDLVPPPFSFESTKFLTRGAMLLVAIGPASYWLWLYRK